MELRAGIPSMVDYWRLVQTPIFRQVEEFSDRFLSECGSIVKKYKWVRDPFHQWSRQWEYPYVLQEIGRIHELGGGRGLSVLDIGSGFTFFPYLLSSEFPESRFTCCDKDVSLQPLFRWANETRESVQRVRFDVCSPNSLPYNSDQFDVAYSVSVLEHVQHPSQMLGEIARILSPGGSLILTFDVGLDGVSNIHHSRLDALYSTLAHHFEFDSTASVRYEHDSMVRSSVIGRDRPDLLPWVFPRLSLLKSAIRARMVPNRLAKELTFCCLTLRKLPGGS